MWSTPATLRMWLICAAWLQNGISVGLFRLLDSMLWKKDQGGGEGRVLTYDIGDGGRLVARDEVVEEAHHDDAAIVYLRIDQ